MKSANKIHQSITKKGNPYLLSLIEIAEDDEYMILITEICDVDLDAVLKWNHRKTQCNKIPFESTLKIMKQVMVAIKSLHDDDIIYRDLKPENIMF